MAMPISWLRNVNDDTACVLLRNGDGSFQTQGTFGLGPDPEGVVVCGFNGERYVDIAAANYGGSVSVLLGNGDGSFQAQAVYDVASHVYGLAVGDLNADGHIDIAAVSYADNAVIGDGSFQAPAAFAAGPSPFDVAGGDYNGDGHPDVVVAITGGKSVSVLLGKELRCLGRMAVCSFWLTLRVRAQRSMTVKSRMTN